MKRHLRTYPRPAASSHDFKEGDELDLAPGLLTALSEQLGPASGVAPVFITTGVDPDAVSNTSTASVTVYRTDISVTGASEIVTLPAGAVVGHRKKLYFLSDGGGNTVQITALIEDAGGTVFLTATDSFLDLMWTGTAWRVLENANIGISP